MMDVEELRRIIKDAGLLPPADVAAARRKVGRRARRRRLLRRAAGAGVTMVAVGALLTAVVARVSPDASTRVVTGAPGASALLSAPLEISFASQSAGLALVDRCDVPANADPVCDLGVASTDDGGSTWTPTAVIRHVVYSGWRGYPFIHLLAQGPDVWIYGTKTFVSHDGGHTFKDEPLDEVVTMAANHTTAWALTRPCPPSQSCLAALSSSPVHAGHWERLPNTPSILDPYVELIRPTDSTAYLVPLDDASGPYRTQDAGRSWTRSELPDGCGPPWHFAAYGATAIWSVCNGTPLESVRLNSVYSSTDGGTRWSLLARLPWTALTAPPPGMPDYVDRGMAVGLSATAPDRLWMTVQGGLVGSTDAGRTWFDAQVPAAAVFFRDPLDGWATDSQGATYRTTDGRHWTRLQSR